MGAMPSASLLLLTLLLFPAAPAAAEPPADEPPAGEPGAEASGQISWVDPQAGAFGLETDGEEMELRVGAGTVITRDGRPATLEDVQPGDWAVACTWRMEEGRRVCLRLEIQTPPEEEGLE